MSQTYKAYQGEAIFRRQQREARTTGRGMLPCPQGAGRVECQVVDPAGLPMQASVMVLDQAGHCVTQGGTDSYGLFTVVVLRAA
jgi:hypothetical protein